jgi:hypothetical protein
MEQKIAPKADFLKSPSARSHAELVMTPAFRYAVQAAMLQFVSEQPWSEPTDFNTSARNALRLEGARRYLSILLNLAEKEIQRPIHMANDNLPNET